MTVAFSGRGAGRSLVGNKGYRRYVSAEDPGILIDVRKLKEGAQFDGTRVLQTNTDVPASEVALKYTQLLMAEMIFRSMNSVLETRPIYNKIVTTARMQRKTLDV